MKQLTVQVDLAKKSRKYSEKERRLVAYHEAGHAVLGLTLEAANKVQKVTIVPRGQAGGYNLMTPKEETYFQTKTHSEANIAGIWRWSHEEIGGCKFRCS